MGGDTALLTTIVFTVIFGSLANLTTLDVKATEETVIPAFLFYMAGTICWSYFSSTVSSTANTFITNSSIMGKVYFPRLVSPAASTISNLISFGIQFAMFLIFCCILYGKENGNSIVQVSLSISNIDHSDDDAGDGSWNYCFSAYNKIS